MKTLTLILSTILLTSCASYQFGDATKLAVGVALEVADSKQQQREHKCKMDKNCTLYKSEPNN